MAKKRSKAFRIKVTTPVGRFSFPKLDEPDTGGEYSDDKYKTDFLIEKKTWKKEGKVLTDAILKVARKHFGDEDLELTDFKHPLKDMDKQKVKKGKAANPKTLGHVMIRAKSNQQPIIVGPNKEELTAKQIKAIKGGDWGRLILSVQAYDQSEGGVTVYLNGVQYWKKGEPFGDGKEKMLEELDELEVTMDDVDFDDESEDDEDED